MIAGVGVSASTIEEEEVLRLQESHRLHGFAMNRVLEPAPGGIDCSGFLFLGVPANGSNGYLISGLTAFSANIQSPY